MRFALATVLVVGCGSVDEPEEVRPVLPVRPFCTEAELAAGPATRAACVWQPEQGRFIVSKAGDGLAALGRHIAVPSPAITLDSTTRLISIWGVEVGETPVQIRTTSAGVPFEITGPGPAYSVRYDNGNGWQPLCEGGELAYAVEGQWNTAGLHIRPNDGHVTLSCATWGKAAWCTNLGYVPSDGENGVGWGLNQSCVQMAMANYCVDGTPHTREKTPVQVRDPDGIQFKNEGEYLLTPAPEEMPPIPPPPSQFFMEAIWRPYEPVLCLSKFRWASMPLGSPCPGPLPDPRGHDGTGTYCEDYDLTTLAGVDDWIMNGSRVMDVKLNSWRNTAGTDRITSVNGVVWEGTATGTTEFPTRVPPLGGANEGFMLRSLTGMMYLPGEIPLPGMTLVRPVFRLRNFNNGDKVAVPQGVLDPTKYGPASGAVLPASNADEATIAAHPDFEGFLIMNAYPGQTLPLVLYRSGTNLVTSTYQPNGWMPVATLGNVIAGNP